MLTYLFDPLCGWCYACAPAIAGLARDWPEQITLAPNALFSGTGARALNADWADYAWTNDQRIAAKTGQVFSEAYHRDVLNAGGARFDSGAINRALTAVDPALELPLLASLQNARYVEGRDTSRADVVAEVMGDPTMAARLCDDRDLAERTQARIADAQSLMTRLGLRGVPQLLIEIGGAQYAIASEALYQGPDHLMTHLRGMQEALA